MSEQSTPKFENEIRELLDGDLMERALVFAKYLNENGLTPRLWFGPTYWRVPYETNYLCGIKLDKGLWRFWFFQGDYGGELDEGIKDTVREKVGTCTECSGDCKPVPSMTVFGKEFSDVCCNFPIQFENPDENTVEEIKGLMDYWKGVAPRSESWHVRD